MFEPALSVDPAQVHPPLAAAVAAMTGRVARGGTAAECDQRVRSLMVLSRQVEGLLLAQIAAFDDQGFAFGCGAKSTGSYLAAHGHLDPGAARRLVLAARTADRLPQVGAMLAAGDISVDHVAAVGFSTRRVPPEAVTAADPIFASLACSARPSDLRVAGGQLTELYDTDAAAKDAHHVRDSRYLTLVQTFGNAWHLEGLLAGEDGVALALVLDSLSTKAGVQDDRTPTQRCADALVEMANLALRAGELPDTGGDQPRVTLMVHKGTNPFAHPGDDNDQLNADLDAEFDADLDAEFDADLEAPLAAGATSDAGGTSGGLSLARHRPGVRTRRGDTGFSVTGFSVTGFRVTGFGLTDAQLLGADCQISTETMQRICCDAELNIAAIDAAGNVMNLGRSCRDPNLHQKRAVKIRDKHCVFPGCDTPPHRCQIHHLHFWGEGGCTDLSNLALVCHFHHHLIHEEHWTLASAPPTTQHPAGGWTATAPDGRQYRQHRQHAA